MLMQTPKFRCVVVSVIQLWYNCFDAHKKTWSKCCFKGLSILTRLPFCQRNFFSFRNIHASFNPKMSMLRLTFNLSWFTLIACMSDKTKCLSVSNSQDIYIDGCVCLYVWVEGFQGIAYLLAAFIVTEERLRRKPSVVLSSFLPVEQRKRVVWHSCVLLGKLASQN